MENFDFLKTVKEAIITKVVDLALQSFFVNTKPKLSNDTNIISKLKFEENILLHFNELYNWSKEIELIGLSKPISVVDNTIDLSFYYSLRRENKDVSSAAEFLSEDDIISINENVIIEGSPGSGKTTTLKRLISYYFFSKKNRKTVYNYPILIRLRAVEKKYDLYTYVCHILGIPYETKEKIVENKIIRTRKVRRKNRIYEEPYEEIEIKKTYFNQVNNVDLDIFIADLIDTNKILLILDGIDELRPEMKDVIYSQLQELTLKLTQSKILITTRPNHLKTTFHNSIIFQINSLSKKQMAKMASLWLKDSTAFLNQLKSKSYFELANRPLFLSFLILLYQEQRFSKEKILPKSSKGVYEQILELLINKWDKERNVKRESNYAYFDSVIKIDFLTHLSFKLTYIIKAKIFSHDDFVKVFEQIHAKFDLPIDQGNQVAEEIESHTGIIVKSFYNKYEFSHLAIQEYLCAKYILNAPFNENIDTYLREYPAPLAIAVGLSTDPSLWLYELGKVISSKVNNKNQLTQIYTQLLDRLYIESPYFEATQELSIAIADMCNICVLSNKDFTFFLFRLIQSNPNLVKAIVELVSIYSYNKQNAHLNQIFFTLQNGKGDYRYPDVLLLPADICRKMKIISG